MKGLFAILAVLPALIAATPVLAGGEPSGGIRRGPDVFANIYAMPDLKLSVEQAERIAALRDVQIKESRQLRRRFYAKGRELRKLWLARKPDRKRIERLQAEVRTLRRQLNDSIENFRKLVSLLLTSEQRKVFDAFELERRHRHQRKMQSRPELDGDCRKRDIRVLKSGKGGRQLWD